MEFNTKIVVVSSADFGYLLSNSAAAVAATAGALIGTVSSADFGYLLSNKKKEDISLRDVKFQVPTLATYYQTSRSWTR
jgi:mevalonate pyrophosphate decarboxylase